MIKKIIECRNCKKLNFYSLFSLGSLAYTGKFTKKIKQKIPREKISLVMCKHCSLVQLDRNFNPKYLYASDYGYRSGLNQTMTNHLKLIVKDLSHKSGLKKNDFVLDIASNDGTLLNSYTVKGVKKVGIDPLINKYKIFYKDIDYQISDFFSLKKINYLKIKKKFKIITTISMFYDLDDPNKFLNEVSQILDQKRGIFLLEHADLLSIIQKNLFDTICHEHLEYYSTKVINKMLLQNNLKIFDIERNNINGGSVRYYISSIYSDYKTQHKKISDIIEEENRAGLEKIETYKFFYKKIIKIKNKLLHLLKKLNHKGKKVFGYGASTKGNVLLQFFKISNKMIKHISDRNHEKNNCYTPGTKIPIFKEEISRKLMPDYYLVLPWHFKEEILRREKKLRQLGTKFIFPLPKIKIL